MYIIRFGSMRKTYKAAEWALVRLLALWVRIQRLNLDSGSKKVADCCIVERLDSSGDAGYLADMVSNMCMCHARLSSKMPLHY
jgi:hypothetical protein